MRGLLSWHTYGLSHLSVDWCLRRAAVVRNTLLLLVLLLHFSAVALVVGLARGLLLLLLGFPFFANFLELYSEKLVKHTIRLWC